MKTKYLPLFPVNRVCRISSQLAVSMVLCVTCSAQITTEFVGPEIVEPFTIHYWDDGDNWTGGVPSATDNVVVRVPEDENNQPIPDFGPLLQSDVTINSITMDGDTTIRGNGENFFVQGSSLIKAAINYGGEFSFGTLLDFNPATKTLEAGPNLVVSESSVFTQPIMQFRGADIVTNRASFQAFGPNVKFLDQNTAANALQNLATNHGLLNLNDGFELQLSGNFTNGPTGRIILNNQNQGQWGFRVARITIPGNFTNNGEVELFTDTAFTVSGGLSGGGSIKVLGQPCALNVVGTYLLEGGNFNFGGTGIDSFTLITTALVVNSGGSVTGNGTTQGSMTVVEGSISPGNSAGQIAVNGDLTLQAGSTLNMEIGGSTHDKLIQSGGLTGTTLGGVLTLATIGNFDEEVLQDSTYEILASGAPITGAFSNVAHDQRVVTLGGGGSFLVSYGPSSAAPNKVILSDYIANIVPQSYSQWADGLAPGQNGGADDANGGVSNLEAYYRGMPADGSRTAKPLGITTEVGMLKLTLRSPKTVTGVTVSTILTSDFIVDQPGPAPVLAGETPTFNIYEIEIPASGPKLFATLKFEISD